MNKNHNIPNELKDVFPTLASIGNGNVYSIPTGYFETLPKKIITRIRIKHIEEIPNPFSVPADYFDKLPELILNKIKNDKIIVSQDIRNELEEIAPLLLSINKNNIYEVPDNYFQPISVTARLPVKTAKVISFGSSIRKWITYTAAASVIFIIATSSYLYVNQHAEHAKKNPNIAQKLAALNDEEITNYQKEDPDANFLSPVVTEDESDLQQLFMNASDEEIQRYLEETSGSSVEKDINGI